MSHENEHDHSEAPRHARRQMRGRDTTEVHRAATPLELLFDLTFVLAFGHAANQFAHFVADAHLRTALIGFGVSSFAIGWAWINFTWFASAFDTDDWVYRLLTMLQMLGVLIFTLGLPKLFYSLDAGGSVDIQAVVAGYVVMRIAMVWQWLRAAKQEPRLKRTCQAYAIGIVYAQVLWIGVATSPTEQTGTLWSIGTLILWEMAVPIYAERLQGGTPWHAHHIAERYGLLAIIALGEGLVGSIAALSALVESMGWTWDIVYLGLCGVGITFGMWWVYFLLPSAHVLSRHRNYGFQWGYGNMILATSIVAMGAGLHVAAYYVEHKYKVDALGAVLSVAIPMAVYIVMLSLLNGFLIRRYHRTHMALMCGNLAVICASVPLAMAGVPLLACLGVLAAAQLVTIVGYECLGYRTQRDALSQL